MNRKINTGIQVEIVDIGNADSYYPNRNTLIGLRGTLCCDISYRKWSEWISATIDLDTPNRSGYKSPSFFQVKIKLITNE